MMVVGLGLLTYSCYYDQLPDEEDIPLPVDVSFQGQIQPLLNQNCVSCHSGAQEPDLRAQSSFDELINGHVVPFDADSSIFFNVLIGRGNPLMPPGGKLNQLDINLVKVWINEGALNN